MSGSSSSSSTPGASDPDFSDLAAFHTLGDDRVPLVVLALAGRDDPELVWRNELGGLTFRIGERYVKWNPCRTGIDLERLDIVLRYTYNQLFPELDLIGSYGFAGSGKEFSGALGQIGAGSGPNYSFGASVTIPLGNRAARGNYKITKEQKKLALLQLKKQEQGILVQIDDAVKQVQNAFERVDATRQARAYAETALDAEQKKLESGKSTSFQVLQFQRDLTARRSEEIRALADFNKALSQLYFLEGSILDRNHVRLEVK